MVQLCVKGTKFPDEFVFECSCSDSVKQVTHAVTHAQNMRHKVRLQLHSMGDLKDTVAKNFASTNPDLVKRYTEAYQAILAAHKNPKLVCSETLFDTYWNQIKDLTVEAFPKECTHRDGEAAAVTVLWELHENPDLDEDYRLHVYHCRAILDPQWRESEVLDEEKTALWFCGKRLETTKVVGDYCGNNPKSKLTVKVALAAGPAPSGEPRMSYDDQRALRTYAHTKRETFRSLEESELRDRVLRQTRGQVLLGGNGGGSGVAPEMRVLGVTKPLAASKLSAADEGVDDAPAAE